jgi:hypothetical protein
MTATASDDLRRTYAEEVRAVAHLPGFCLQR